MNDARLSRSARLRNPSDFAHVFQARRAVSNRFFRIHWAPTRLDPPGGPRLGLAIAKRVARRAVDRNRLRRLARERFRLHRARLPAADYVVLARPAAVEADRRELNHALDDLWLKLQHR